MNGSLMMSEIPLTEEDLARAAMCETAEDLYKTTAREVIARVCKKFLDAERRTAIEFLYSPELLKKFTNAGTFYSGAVQKVAIHQVKGSEKKVSQRVKELYALTDALMETPMIPAKDVDWAEELAPQKLDELVTSKDLDESKRTNMIFAALTRHQEGLKTWPDKFTRAVKLAKGVKNPKTLDYLDRFMAEFLRSPSSISPLLGDPQRVGGRIRRLIQMKDGERLDDRGEFAEIHKDFARLTEDEGLPHCREALVHQIVRDLAAPKTIDSLQTDAEFEGLVEIAEKLEAYRYRENMAGGQTAYKELERRFKTTVNDQKLAQLLTACVTQGDKAQRSLEILSKTIGHDTDLFLIRYIDKLFKEPGMEKKIYPENSSTNQQLKRLSDVFSLVKDSAKLDSSRRDPIMNQVRNWLDDLVEDSKYFETIDKRPGSTSDKAMQLIDICAGGTFPDGKHKERARDMAMQYMRRPDFFKTLLARCHSERDKARVLMDLKKKLHEAGFRD